MSANWLTAWEYRHIYNESEIIVIIWSKNGRSDKVVPFTHGHSLWLGYFAYFQSTAVKPTLTVWRHQNEAFSALRALCAGNWPATGEFPSQRPMVWSFGVFFDWRLNIRLSKESRRRWFETPSRWLSRHCNVPEQHWRPNTLWTWIDTLRYV